jgi:hypothetical protein
MLNSDPTERPDSSNHIRLGSSRFGEHALRIVGLTNDFEVSLSLQQLTDTRPDDFVTIGDKTRI